jgi:hypothetical protein
VLGAGARGASLLTVPSITELVTIKKSEAEIANASTVAASTRCGALRLIRWLA